jgi:uncharacterized protein (DUF1697 family)
VSRVVVLLRGINVGGRTLPMAELRAICDGLGYADPVTYIQSGNVVADIDMSRVGTVPSDLSGAILERTGLGVEVVVRSGAELAAVLAANPFADADLPDPYVTFLAAPVADPGIPGDAGSPDRFAFGDGVVYVACPSGYGRTVLTNQFFERRLGVAATTRNWRTVNRLAEMAA